MVSSVLADPTYVVKHTIALGHGVKHQCTASLLVCSWRSDELSLVTDFGSTTSVLAIESLRNITDISARRRRHAASEERYQRSERIPNTRTLLARYWNRYYVHHEQLLESYISYR